MDFDFEVQAEAPAPAAVQPRSAGADAARMSNALWALAAGLLIGYLSSIFFFGKAIGLSFPLFIALLVAGGLAAALRAGVRLTPGRLWLAAPALFFAAMVAVRASGVMSEGNVLMALGLGALWLYYLPRRQRADEATTDEHAYAVLDAALGAGAAPPGELVQALGWLRSRSSERMRGVIAVARGLALALPIVLVFAALLSTADAVFSRALNDLWRLIGFGSLEQLVPQGTMIALFGWLGCGIAAYVLTRAPREQRPDDAAAKPQAKRRPLLLSMIEAMIVLGAVNLLFGLFVVIQFGYFFGGQGNISVEGLTYAEYARRGFFELVAVAVLSLGLILALDWVTVRSGRGEHRAFRILALALVGFVGVMMASAQQRMNLYQEAYGFTMLRVMVSTFIPWLALLFGFFVLALLRVRERIFSLGVLVCVIGFAAHLNLMNPEAYIAQHNIDRYLAGAELDGTLFYRISVDAVDPLLTLWRADEADADARDYAGTILNRLRTEAEQRRTWAGSTLFSAHWAYAYADVVLAGLELPYVYDSGRTYFPQRKPR